MQEKRCRARATASSPQTDKHWAGPVQRRSRRGLCGRAGARGAGEDFAEMALEVSCFIFFFMVAGTKEH